MREHNEDTIGVDADIGLFVLADGMGGYNAGEVASGIAVKTVMSLVKEAVEHQDMTLGGSGDRPGAARASCCATRSRAPTRSSTRPPRPSRNARAWARRSSPACSSTTAWRSPTSAIRALYRLRANRFEQMTMDHSLLQELVDRGFYSPGRGAAGDQQELRHARARGRADGRGRDARTCRSQKGDFFVLCSDGLSDMVEDDDIHLTISTFSASLETVAKQLIQLSNDNGGRDNVSIILAQVVDSFAAKTG